MLSEDDGKELLQLARKTVKKYFLMKELVINESIFREKQGVFASIHTKKGELRGCIGYPLPVYPLGEAVQRESVSAAFDDPRFPPLTKNELSKVVFEISVLTKPELIEVEDPKEYLKKIKIGKDGLIIEFGLNSGLLLPQVATEHKLAVKKFLEHICYKAGLPTDIWRSGQVKIYKFQAQIFRED